MVDRYWPLGTGRMVTSPFGLRPGEFHKGVDFGKPGGSANAPVYAIQSGEVIYAGAAQGYGGPDPAGWLVIDSSDEQGGGCLEYGHIRRLPNITVGTKVVAGQQIAVVNPDSGSNGGVAPHLHVSDMPVGYDPAAKQDPMVRLKGAREPGARGADTAVLVGKKEQVPSARPDFNEYWVSSPSRESRGGTRIDLFLLHTQEGAGNADSLARYLADPSKEVSYHYTVSEDYGDHGVTVCDVVDTDYASWSCLSANRRSINLCFAGSSAAWSRDQWMEQSRAIDVAAYLAVQDCRKYNIPLKVLSPPYRSAPPGISDHKYVTQFLGDGTHTDVGNQFPWDYFAQCVAKWAGGGAKPPAPAPPAPPAPNPAVVARPSQQDMVAQIWEQLVGPGGKGWPQLGGKTLVDAVADLAKRVP